MQLHDTLYLMLNDVSQRLEHPIPLIFAYQNSERINKPYGSIRVDTISIPQHELYLPVQETGYQVFGGWRKATVELQIYGKNSGATARRFALSLQSNTSTEFQQKINVAIGNRLFLGEVPVLLNASQYEERGVYQFEFYYSDEMDDNIGLIEKVEITHKHDESFWDEIPHSIWDDNDLIWDWYDICKIYVEAYPPHTPIHPSP